MNKLRLSHFPQIPCKSFTVEVSSLEEALKISDVLANYDLFQFDNNIKPNYCNMTTLEEFDEEVQAWINWEDDEGDYFEEYELEDGKAVKIMNKKYYLLEYSDNWADEMDVEGIYVMNEKELQEFNGAIEVVKENFRNGREFYFYVGTNEEIEYSSERELSSSYNVFEISSEEVEVLAKHGIMDIGFASNFVARVIDYAEEDYKD